MRRFGFAGEPFWSMVRDFASFYVFSVSTCRPFARPQPPFRFTSQFCDHSWGVRGGDGWGATAQWATIFDCSMPCGAHATTQLRCSVRPVNHFFVSWAFGSLFVVASSYMNPCMKRTSGPPDLHLECPLGNHWTPRRHFWSMRRVFWSMWRPFWSTGQHLRSRRHYFWSNGHSFAPLGILFGPQGTPFSPFWDLQAPQSSLLAPLCLPKSSF